MLRCSDGAEQIPHTRTVSGLDAFQVRVVGSKKLALLAMRTGMVPYLGSHFKDKTRRNLVASQPRLDSSADER